MTLKKMWHNKKGVFYMFLSSIIILVIILVFTVYNNYKYTDQQKVVETRISTINDFLKDIDSDSARVIYVAGYRSLIAIEDYVSRTGYLNDSESVFKVAFYNGTINNTKIEVLNASSYSDYLSKLKVISKKVGIDVFLNVTDITLYHETPWTVTVVVSTYVYVNDTRGAAYWSFNKDYKTEVPLVNIRDPVYSVATGGLVPNTIRQTPIPFFDFVIDETNDTTGLRLHVNNSYYRNNTMAPSFLMRLEGNFSPSPFGIESIVDIQKLIDASIAPNAARSLIDYIQFTNITGYETKACNVKNMSTEFRIDLNHTVAYEVNKLNFTQC